MVTSTSLVFVIGCFTLVLAAKDLSDIRAYGGTAYGMACHFPFLYNGSLQHTCVSDNLFNGRSWCSALFQYTGESPHNLYGFCDIEYTLSDFKTVEGNDSPNRCVFPFIFNNRYHFDCVPDSNGRRWCATSSNYDVDGRWGFCGKKAEDVFVSNAGLVRRYYKRSVTWQEASDFCKFRSSRLCSYDEVCVGGYPLGGTVEGEHWVAIEHTSQTWVNIGDIHGWACLNVTIPSGSDFSSRTKGYVMCCDFGITGFSNYAKLDRACLDHKNVDQIYKQMTLQECHGVCENQTSCKSFTYKVLDEICILSQYNSITAASNFNLCGNETDRYSFYFEKILHRNDSSLCEFPFTWENRLHHVCIEIEGQDYCVKRDGGSAELMKCEDCFDIKKPSSYRGRLNKSRSGLNCINWKLSIFNWEEGEYGLGDHNYCRNPDQDKLGVWCYVEGTETNFEYCDLPSCDTEPQQLPLHELECGKMDLIPGFLPKIYGGRFSSQHFNSPWQVSLYHVRSEKHDCGGALISRCYVATAAHCFKRSKFLSYVVRGGFELGFRDRPEQVREIENVFIHPFYTFGLQEDDIAVIKLKSCFTITEKLQTICLPKSASQFTNGFQCVASGFGETEDGEASQRLKFVWLPLIDNEACSHESVYGSRITNGMQCAGSMAGVADTCRGDSGGPLSCRDPVTGNWHLWGIVSWGESCGDSNKPGVYTRVERYLPWINCVISSNRNCQN
nr:plasminogen-like [Ciona intestinalis]|eukprot:XP_004226137.1 plasminogen-like [Ciona intestinalis]